MNLLKFAQLNILLFAMILFQACSTPSAVGTSAGVGAGLGAGIGALADPGPNGQNRFRNVVVGAGVGTLIGTGAGLMIDQNNKNQREEGKKDAKKEFEEEMKRRNSQSSSGSEPRLIPPKTEAKWVPEQVRGSTYVPGHFEYLIVEPARWEGN